MQQFNRFPDFFIVGAPRCGTTALGRYLARNPQIGFSRPKESHYFSRITGIPTDSELQHDYLERYFGHCTDRHRVMGEGSVTYLHLPEALQRILHFNPQARFIAMVRNPLSMLPSYHQRMLFLLQEDEQDFATAWSLEPARARLEHLPRRCLDHRLLLYSEVAKLGFQVNRLFEIVGREKAHVIVFDDLIAEPFSVYRKVVQFLGVDYDGQTTFERKLGGQMYRYGWLQKLLFAPVVRGGKIVDTLQRRKRKYNEDGSKQKIFIKRITGLNRVYKSPDPLSEPMLGILREALRDDVALLSRVLDRDLNSWLKRPSED
jgi:Sulfotransferase domain